MTSLRSLLVAGEYRGEEVPTMEPCGCPQWSAATRDEDRGLKLVRGVAAGVTAHGGLSSE